MTTIVPREHHQYYQITFTKASLLILMLYSITCFTSIPIPTYQQTTTQSTRNTRAFVKTRPTYQWPTILLYTLINNYKYVVSLYQGTFPVFLCNHCSTHPTIQLSHHTLQPTIKPTRIKIPTQQSISPSPKTIPPSSNTYLTHAIHLHHRSQSPLLFTSYHDRQGAQRPNNNNNNHPTHHHPLTSISSQNARLTKAFTL